MVPRAGAGYIQITDDQEELWGADAGAFVADEEDDMVSVRTSGQLVLDELLQAADGAAGILSSAVGRRLEEAAHLKVLSTKCDLIILRSECVPSASSCSMRSSAGQMGPLECCQALWGAA